VICFPECYVPGYRWPGQPAPAPDPVFLELACAAVADAAQRARVAVILGTERVTDRGLQITACVINPDGAVAGWQDKGQIDPSEEANYPALGTERRLFSVGPLTFGVAICHEGFRYPETVRWAAVRGAKIVFHPHCTGSDREGVRPTEWGAAGGPYYEKAMMMRGLENTIYFASVNYALRFQESATCLIDPSGQCQAYLPYGEEGVLVQGIKVEEATGLMATRYAPERHRELTP
jgi:predicted amidohydrolase